ncbi:hypothetical protein [Hydrogenothermus marinus]|uniref:Uncharacterized protein n=1 Tax=Hydrogenothermus marinus TaxID=133270 RepID=A0A3M0BQ90_9AQUI|nr:hypothetical protein [Hydrogenothermus marinus]RMA93082.1 hypothetical protein CLV39_1565 [Hydrogenothermus marinus]
MLKLGCLIIFFIIGFLVILGIIGVFVILKYLFMLAIFVVILTFFTVDYLLGGNVSTEDMIGIGIFYFVIGLIIFRLFVNPDEEDN